MFQAEPFMFLAAMIAVPMGGEKLKKFQYWLLSFALFNLLLAIAQSILLPLGIYPSLKAEHSQIILAGYSAAAAAARQITYLVRYRFTLACTSSTNLSTYLYCYESYRC